MRIAGTVGAVATTFVALAVGACSTAESTTSATPSDTTLGPVDSGTVVARKDAGPAQVDPDSGPFSCTPAAGPNEIYSLSAHALSSTEVVSLCQFRGKVMLIFNGASYCGNTPQYTPLEELYEANEAKGLVVLGFPCNQFGAQEPGTAEEISSFCTTKYHITFPMFEKIDVNGASTHPIYTWLKAQPGGAGEISWNFEKFLIGRDGKLIKRFAPATLPSDPSVTAAIAEALAKPVP